MGVANGTSRADALYWNLREALTGGELRPGERVREVDVTARYGVSRTPAREALQRLQMEGLLEELPGQGLTVSNPSLNDILDAYLVREVLEGLATRLATERALDVDRLRLESVVNQMRAAFADDDQDTTIKLFNLFDEVVFSAASSERLYRMIYLARASQGQTLRNNVRMPGRLGEAVEERVEIFEAFKHRDAIAAETATREHLRKARELRLATSLNASV